MEKDILTYIGKSLYQTHILKEMKRYLVFRSRCALHSSAINDLLAFFDANEKRRAWLKGNPSFVEQVTRGFFYKGSTWKERLALVKNHILILEELFTPEFLDEIYTKNEKMMPLWKDNYQDKLLTLNLMFHAGQRKEGCLTLALRYNDDYLYQIMFWFAKDADGKNVIYIGALQGPQNGNELIKGLTKAFFGYRTKNLVFYGLRSLAKALGIEKIYAVGNEGYYAMNHIRVDRKLKTDFGAFWQECEGVQCADKRFYVMPVEEHRKSMEELKPSKRAQHRRRFAKMDEMESAVAESLKAYMR